MCIGGLPIPTISIWNISSTPEAPSCPFAVNASSSPPLLPITRQGQQKPSLQFLFCGEFRMGGIIQLTLFCVWPLSLSIVLSSSLHTVACINHSFMQFAEQCFMVQIYQIWVPHTSWTFGSFPVFVNRESSCYEHSCTGLCVDICSHFFWVNTQSGIARSCGKYMFNFIRIFQTLSKWLQMIFN